MLTRRWNGPIGLYSREGKKNILPDLQGASGITAGVTDRFGKHGRDTGSPESGIDPCNGDIKRCFAMPPSKYHEYVGSLSILFSTYTDWNWNVAGDQITGRDLYFTLYRCGPSDGIPFVESKQSK